MTGLKHRFARRHDSIMPLTDFTCFKYLLCNGSGHLCCFIYFSTKHLLHFGQTTMYFIFFLSQNVQSLPETILSRCKYTVRSMFASFRRFDTMAFTSSILQCFRLTLPNNFIIVSSLLNGSDVCCSTRWPLVHEWNKRGTPSTS